MKSRVYYAPVDEKNERKSEILYNKNGTPFQSIINLTTMTYKIVNKKTRSIVRSTEKDKLSPAVSENYLIRQAKKALLRVGIKFQYEIRRT